ncbi:MAG TPA: hypothetical protein VKU41_32845 [Polyangiaceae bacterium]|nr:hypothetical protein [Polyangiaceae bacterium]
MTRGDDLVGLLGAPADDPRVVDALQSFAIRWPPQLQEPVNPDDPNYYVWRPSSANGFEFGFQDQAHLCGLDPSLRGKSPLVLSSVCFYGEHEGVRPFAGDFPFGVLLGDSRSTVRAKLSRIEVGPRIHIRDVWDTSKFRIVAEHDPRSGALDSFLVKLPLLPWPPLDEDPAPKLPTADEIVALFGQAWHSPDMRRVFFPLGLDACGPAIATRHAADLRRTRGIELDFFADPSRGEDNPIKDKGAAFSAVKLYRARHLDARPWAGRLPCGLEYDLAYPEIARRVGRPPDEHRDGRLAGYALWHLPAFTLHVHVDNVDNVIFRLSLYRPGSWQGMTP